ncbi:MAG: BACON domain-containing protein [Bacteroidales bacterium]|nr:BACON domain-containing protein [Bacteroidales bacterium]
MKKFLPILLSVVFTIIIVAQFSSCEKYVLPSLSLSQDTLTFSPEAQDSELIIETNVIWSADNTSNWIILNPSEGELSDTITISVTKNDTGNKRSYKISFNTETIKKSVVIIQNTPEL